MDPLDLAYQQTLDRIRDTVGATATVRWRGLGDWSGDTLPAWLDTIIPLVEAGQETMASTAAAYASQALDVPAVAVDTSRLVGDAVRRAPISGGAAPTSTEVYSRAYQRVWHQLAEGAPLDQAVDAGETELSRWLDTDLTDATWAGTEAAGDAADAYGYIWQPTSGHVCGFCITAASRVYREIRDEHLHPACRCYPRPVTNIGTADQHIQPYKQAYRAHIKPAMSQQTRRLGRPRGTDGHTRDLSRLSHQHFHLAADGHITPI